MRSWVGKGSLNRRGIGRRLLSLLTLLIVAAACLAQQTSTSSGKPSSKIVGTVATVDKANQSVTVKEDKTNTEYTVQLASTKTIFSVPPGTKPEDLKKVAKRISATDIQPGDRIEIYYLPSTANGNAIAARAAIVMSGSALQAARLVEAEAWQHSTVGVISSLDSASGTLLISIRTAEGTRPVTVSVSDATQFTRYSAEDPKTPAPSSLADLQPGDIIRVIGETSPDGSKITAQKIYLAPEQLPAQVVSISGNTLTVKDLRNKQNVTVQVTSQTQIHKLPEPIAYALARRINPAFRNAAGSNGGNLANAPSPGARSGEATGQARWQGQREAGAGGPGGHMRTPGDLSRLIENAPQIQLSDLKPGDAVAISGAPAPHDHSQLLASTIVAGVEPIFQSAPPRQGQSLGDWSLDMSMPSPEQ
jgi:hypothetical protein